MGDLDFVAKILMRAAPQAFVRLCLGRDVRVIECRGADKEIERLNWAARMPKELLMESTVYKQGEAAGKLEGERELVEVLLREKLPGHADALVPRLQACAGDQLTELARLLVHDKPTGELVAQIERLLTAS